MGNRFELKYLVAKYNYVLVKNRIYSERRLCSVQYQKLYASIDIHEFYFYDWALNNDKLIFKWCNIGLNHFIISLQM